MADETAPAEGAPPAVLPEPVPAAETVLPPGVQPSRNYVKAIELGHVLAASGYYADARDPAKAAVKVMIGMDLGLSPTASLQAIHAFEDDGKVSFIIEGKLLAALIKARPGYDYRFTPVDPDDPSKGVIRSPEKVSIDFYRDDEKIEPSIEWTIERAREAVKDKIGMYRKYPAEMLTWRALSEGTRVHFPELLVGHPIYADVEFGVDASDEIGMREALEPAKAQPLTDEKAEKLRAEARTVFDELKQINPDRVPPGRFDTMVKGAEHSHERLEGVVASLRDLCETEGEIVALSEKLAEQMPAKEHKELMARAERRGSNREKIELLTAALPGDDAEPEGEPDAEPEEGGDSGE